MSCCACRVLHAVICMSSSAWRRVHVDVCKKKEGMSGVQATPSNNYACRSVHGRCMSSSACRSVHIEFCMSECAWSIVHVEFCMSQCACRRLQKQVGHVGSAGNSLKLSIIYSFI